MNKKLIPLVALVASQIPASAAPIAINGSQTYSQNFDSLGNTSVAWTDDSTLAGWYAQINNGATANGTLQVSDGNDALSGLLNVGATGAPDRALGSKATGTGAFANIAYAASFRNTGATPVALSNLSYTGEMWRANTTANTVENFAVYYQISAAPVTNIISGPNSANPAPGLGFTALAGGAADWSLSNAGSGVALNGNDPANKLAINVPVSGITLAPGQYLTLKFTDQNEAGTDGYQAIDDLSVQFTEVSGLVTAAVSNPTRDFAGTLADPNDDTFGFTVNVTGAGAVAAGWTTVDVNPPAGNTSSANYGTPVVWTGFPVSATKTITISDAITPALNTVLTVPPPKIIGTNELLGAGTPLISTADNITGWVVDETARTLNQNSLPANEDHVVTSKVYDLSATGFVLFSAELDYNTLGGTSGFEAADSFALEVSIDGGPFVSALGAADTDSNGRLTGTVELPAATGVDVTPVMFSYLIPDTANSVQIRITGNSNSPGETLLVKSVQLSTPSATLFASVAGAATVDNKGTADPSDDTFTVPVNVSPVNLGASPGWHSNENPVRSGLYATPNPVIFGPYQVSGGAQTVILTDDANGAISSSPLTFTPPTPAVAATAPANITRVPNGPGAADDVVTFTTTITGTNGGPGWTATGPAGTTPTSGTYSANPVTFTVPAGVGVSSAAVVITDSSYPTATTTITANFDSVYVIGQKNLNGTLSDVLSELVVPPNNLWVNDPVARTISMNNGNAPAGAKTISSEVINLAGVSGDVTFSANLHVSDTSSGFEAGDTFTAHLIYDGNTGAPVSLITNPPDLNANGTLEDDELAAGIVETDIALTATIPDAVNTVQLVITGVTDSASEHLVVGSVLFTGGGVIPTGDTDGDGVSNDDEAIMGTDPNNASDVLRLTQNPATPTQLSFPSKAGKFYRVYVSDDTNEASHLKFWKDAGTGTIAGDGAAKTFNVTVAAGETRRFYILGVQSADAGWPATLGTP
ncbi:MAG TPA: thrombospondin type 3 repeat-containing protein [Verrucomicrobiales bacterium]|nr:thrombospondin type 3 repeat-containing protein [Verrucomicrobiales bacterium]